MTQQGLTRREALARAAATAAGIGLLATVSLKARIAEAKVDPAPDPAKDVEILNALLNAEYDAIATYTAGVGILTNDANKGTSGPALLVGGHFVAQHQQHRDALIKLITTLKGTPAPEVTTPTLPASFKAILATATTTDVIKLACDKEAAAGRTYAEVVGQLTTQTAAALAASIGGVETQHFVVLFLLASGLIVPGPAIKGQAEANLVVPGDFMVPVKDVSFGTGNTLKAVAATLAPMLAIEAKGTGSGGNGGSGGSNGGSGGSNAGSGGSNAGSGGANGGSGGANAGSGGSAGASGGGAGDGGASGSGSGNGGAAGASAGSGGQGGAQ